MTTITMDQIKDLRARTGAGVVDAKEALSAAAGDSEKAITWLREKGKATAAKKADRATHEGYIGHYVHGNGKIAVLVSLLCETDFVARNEKFQQLAQNIAMHIAAMDPLVVSPDDVPESEIEAEKAIAIKQLEGENKPAEIMEKILTGKMKKFKEERALVTQPFVKDPEKTVQQLIEESIQELGENITVDSFSRIAI